MNDLMMMRIQVQQDDGQERMIKASLVYKQLSVIMEPHRALTELIRVDDAVEPHMVSFDDDYDLSNFVSWIKTPQGSDWWAIKCDNYSAARNEGESLLKTLKIT